MKIRRLSALLLVLVFLLFALGDKAFGRWETKFSHTSVNVPLHHWSYEALEKLFVAKLIPATALSTKPLTRMAMARLVAQALENVRRKDFTLSTSAAMVEDTLFDLMDEFKEELLILDAPLLYYGKKKKIIYRIPESLKIRYTYDDLECANILHADNRRGERRFDESREHLELRAWAKFPGAAISLNPTFDYYRHYLEGGEAKLRLREGYLNLSISNLQLEVGRDSLWWGPGYHGALLITDNAFPLDMIKLSNRDPFRLPWVFSRLGSWKMVFFLSQLEDKRVIPKAKLTGIRLEYIPCSFLEFGASRTIMLGGEGRHISFNDYFKVFTASQEHVPGELNNNQLAAFDIRFRIPGAEIYGEFAKEDEEGPFFSKEGYLAGFFIPNIFKSKGTDLRMEYARTTGSWYRHHIYKSGYTYKDFILGHHMGGDADDIFLRLSRRWTRKFSTGLEFDRERRGLSRSWTEEENEVGLDFSFRLGKKTELKTTYCFERIKNFANIYDRDCENHTGEIELNIRF